MTLLLNPNVRMTSRKRENDDVHRLCATFLFSEFACCAEIRPRIATAKADMSGQPVQATT
jgi:hypothetical protein